MCAVTLRDPETRQKILDAARQLIVQNGVQKTSLAQIAQAAGLSKGTLFYYYAAKSDLIFDVTDQHFQQTTYRLGEWANQVSGEMETGEILSHAFHAIVEDELRGKLHHYLIEEAITENGDLKKRFIEKYHEWTRLMLTGLSRIFGPDVDIEVLSRLTISCLDGLVIQSILGVHDVPIEAMASYLADIVTASSSRQKSSTQNPQSGKGDMNER